MYFLQQVDRERTDRGYGAIITVVITRARGYGPVTSAVVSALSFQRGYNQAAAVSNWHNRGWRS